jgi:hypothetical protein
MLSQNTPDGLEHTEVVARLMRGDTIVAGFTYTKIEGERSRIECTGNSVKIISRLVGILKDLGHDQSIEP